MNSGEKQIVSKMIRIYCRHHHGQQDTLCADCSAIEAYAHKRLERCVFEEKKPVCEKCTVHCYPPEKRERIREIMRFAGPKMLLHHPVSALKHLWKKFFN